MTHAHLSFAATLALVSPLQVTFGGDYYVASTGDNNHDGSTGSPWRTLQKAADVMVAGDTCYIREGTYRESVIPVNSGTEGNPITFRAYQAEAVTINGCDTVSSAWTQADGNIYQTSITLDLGHENQIFVNDSEMVWEARWPNVGGNSLDNLLEFQKATMERGTTSTTIKNASIPDWDWSDGGVWVSSHKRWYCWTGEVTGAAPGEISLVDMSDPGGNHICKSGGLFYIFGVRDALDSANEWYYDADAAVLYLWAPDGNIPTGVEVKKRLDAFDLSNRQHITIKHLNFFASTIKTDEDSSGLEMDELTMQHIYHSNKAESRYSSQVKNGLVLYGTHHSLTNSEIAYSSGSGIYLEGSDNWLVNNYIHDVNYIGGYASPLWMVSTDTVFSHNTLYRTGRQGVYFSKIANSLFQYNDVSHAGYLTLDLGLTYGNCIDGGNAEVRYNWFHDAVSTEYTAGIYYDHGCKNIITHHNVVWGVQESAFKNNQHANYLLWYNNTGTSGQHGIRSRWEAAMAKDLHGSRYVNNIVSKDISFLASNYTLENNYSNYNQLTSNRYLASGSGPVDAAVHLDGITSEVIGVGPDAGAYELGGTDWTPGHNFVSAPTFVDTERVLALHRNRVLNASFEDGVLLPWASISGNVALHGKNNPSQWVTNSTTLCGSYSAELGEGQSGISQLVEGLEPNTEYEFMGKLRVDSGESAYLGVRNHGGTEVNANSISSTNSLWTKSTVKFITGADATSAEIFVWKSSAGAGTVYLEDAGVQYMRTADMVTSDVLSDNFENGLSQWSLLDDVTTNSVAQSPVNRGGSDREGALLQDTANTNSQMIADIQVDNDVSLYVQYDFRDTGMVQNPGFQLRSGETSGINLHMRSGSGKLQYNNAGTWTTLDTALDTDAWYRFTISVDPENSAQDQFDLRVQSLDVTASMIDVTYTDLNFQNDLSDFSNVRFHFNKPTEEICGVYHFDNLLMTTSSEELSPMIDLDVDGIDDYWEMAKFSDLITATTESDTDGDASKDQSEYLAGTDPNDASSIFAMSQAAEVDGSDIVLRWHTENHKYYYVEKSADLKVGWVKIPGNIAATPPENTYRVTDGFDGAAKFFRVVLVQ